MEVKVIKSKLLEPSDKFKRVEIKKRLECLEFPIIIRCITKHVNFELLDTRITAAIYFISFSYKKKIGLLNLSPFTPCFFHHVK